MHNACFFHDHRHDRIFVRLPPLLVYAYDLVDAHAAHQVTRDEHEVGCDDSVCVDVPHRVSRRERLFRSDDGHYFDP